ncbi:DNA/RNA non-specific endonuclease [Helicobacter cappadocius]|uniref:DNA/RNA non-specific endonuclease n=1 Tax=Helicobacter cappadocius TaxID=3063998 RepID=A0AA90Q038_9HELI|nr:MULTISPECIES: DNA/RNA non-specific endonuclease [unclassified Helicobacter]MDO7253759.1 DNA/RNA non-specific endonuclease [Helicobacter sp. faydin-H75]MDP2539688.1 DNA/RNA non-specific endonuclease [Helicobacter sp. faydin-H76]
MKIKSLLTIIFICITPLLAVYEHYKIYPPFEKYFTKQKCSLVMDKYYYVNCYSFKHKGTDAIAYKLEGKILELGSAGKRPSFKSDSQVPEQYRTKTQDYTHSGYDRGHTLSNQSMNATTQAQASTFLMSNITPQNPQINQRVWKKAEDRERKLAKQEGEAEVLNIVIYPKNPDYIKDNIAIPESYIKIIQAGNIKECYQMPNHKVVDENLIDYKIDCKEQ